MHTVILMDPKSKNPFSQPLLTIAEVLKDRRARIYTTLIQDGKGKFYTFMTTSKDIHLEVGTWERAFQMLLAKFLEYEFVENKCSQLIFCPRESRNENTNKANLVTMTKSEDGKEIRFTISPAH